MNGVLWPRTREKFTKNIFSKILWLGESFFTTAVIFDRISGPVKIAIWKAKSYARQKKCEWKHYNGELLANTFLKAV